MWYGVVTINEFRQNVQMFKCCILQFYQWENSFILWWRDYMGAGQLKLYAKKKQEIPLILSLEVQHLTLDDITSLIFNPFNFL